MLSFVWIAWTIKVTGDEVIKLQKTKHASFLEARFVDIIKSTALLKTSF